METKPDLTPKDASRELMRCALKAGLATLDKTSGHPYASLVTVATAASGAPIFLISRLALHTQNILVDNRVSLLIDGTDAVGDPLATGRVTLMGRAQKCTLPETRARFLARQPHAQMYADFPDFAFYRLELERAHYIGGFGRIVDLSADDLLLDLGGAEALLEAEGDVVSHMNEDHGAALELYATVLQGGKSGPWRMTSIDPEGFDVVCDGEATRIPFATRVTTANEARLEFKRLAALAREMRGGV